MFRVVARSQAVVPASRVRSPTSMSARSQVLSHSTTSGRLRCNPSFRVRSISSRHSSAFGGTMTSLCTISPAGDPARDHRGLVDLQARAPSRPPRARATGCRRSSRRPAAPGLPRTARSALDGGARLRSASRCAARSSSGRGAGQVDRVGAEAEVGRGFDAPAGGDQQGDARPAGSRPERPTATPAGQAEEASPAGSAARPGSTTRSRTRT